MRASKKIYCSVIIFHPIYSSISDFYGRLGQSSLIQFPLIGVGVWLIDGVISLNCWLFRCFL